MRRAGIDRFRPVRERAGNAAEIGVRRTSQDVTVPSLEELRQRVLEERKRTGLLEDVRDDLCEKPFFEATSRAAGGRSDRTLDLIGRERRNDLDVVAEQLREFAVAKRSVVEVGA